VYTNVLLVILPLFALILFGYICKRTRLLHVTDAPVLNRFVLCVSLPALIVYALLSRHLNIAFVKLPIIFWLSDILVLFLALAAAWSLKWTDPEKGTLILQSLFGNTGYIGYPMATALLPSVFPAAVIIDQVGMSVPLYPGAIVLGAMLGRGKSQGMGSSVMGVFKSPTFLAMVVGIGLALVPHSFFPHTLAAQKLGKMAMDLLKIVGGATIPVVLIAVGLLLRPSALAKHGMKVVVVGFFKLLALPTIAFVISRFVFHVSGELLSVVVLQASMPPSATATMFCGQYEMDGSLAVASFFALTVASAITVPLMLSVLR
jgi:predicted permease